MEARTDWTEDEIERLGIMEFEGNLSREEAEKIVFDLRAKKEDESQMELL